jgi:hypothetical protein
MEGVKNRTPSKKEKKKEGLSMDKIRVYIYLNGDRILFIDKENNYIIKGYTSDIFNIIENWKVEEAGLLKAEVFEKDLNITTTKNEVFPRELTFFIYYIHDKEVDIKIRKINNFYENIKIKVIDNKVLLYYQNLVFKFETELKEKFLELSKLKESYTLKELLNLKKYFHVLIDKKEVLSFI